MCPVTLNNRYSNTFSRMLLWYCNHWIIWFCWQLTKLYVIQRTLTSRSDEVIFTDDGGCPVAVYIVPDSRLRSDGDTFFIPITGLHSTPVSVWQCQTCVGLDVLIVLFMVVSINLALNVPVPYKYGTHQHVEPRFHALEPHLSRTFRALPTRVPRTRAAGRRRPRNSHSHASRGSVHFHAFEGRSSAHFHAIGSRSSAHFHAIRSRCSANFDDSISHAFPRIPAQW